MKRSLVTPLIILAATSVLAAVFIKMANPSFSLGQLTTFNSTTSNPDQFTSSFYAWYLSTAAKNSAFPSTPAEKDALAGWLTRDFYSHWLNIIESTDMDPVLLSQGARASWASHIQTKVLDASATTSTVSVTLGAVGEQHTVITHLVASGNHWVVAAVSPGS